MFPWIETLISWEAGVLGFGPGSAINLHCGIMEVSLHLSVSQLLPFKVELLICASNIYRVIIWYRANQ